MKINKFLEHKVEDINNDEKIKQDFNKYEVKYTLYGEMLFSLDKYKDEGFSKTLNDITTEICTGTLEYCIKYYNIHNKKRLAGDIGSYDNFFLIKKEIKEELIPKDEFEMLINSNKYSL